MRLPEPRWLPWAATVGGIGAMAGAIALACRSGPDATAAVLGVLALLPTAGGMLAWAGRSARAPAPAGSAQLDRAADALAVAVRVQWSREAAVRGLFDPRPLPVRWRAMQREAGDHPELAGAPVAVCCDDVAGLAARFRALPRRRLVVLGPAGSGKTTLAALLARELLEHPEPGDAVPVLLHVSSWDPTGEPLQAWIARRLAEDHPALGDPARYGGGALRLLVERCRVLPVLDGLDEIAPRLLPAALAMINRALAAGGPVIVTCRADEFQSAVAQADVVTAAAVIGAVPVRAADTASYLRDATPPKRCAAWAPVLGQLVAAPAGPLASALSLPLNIWLVRTVYAAPGTDPAELLGFGDADAIGDHLIDALIPALFAGGPADGADGAGGKAPAGWPPEQARAYLSFLARHLARLGAREFAWWELRHALVSDPADVLYSLGFAAMLGLGMGCAGASTFESPWAGLAPALLATVCGGALFGARLVAAGVRGDLAPRRAPRRPRRALRLAALSVFGFGVGAVFAYYYVRGTRDNNWAIAPRDALAGGLSAGLASGLVLAVAALPTAMRVRLSRRNTDTRPRRRRYRNLAYTLVFGAGVFWVAAVNTVAFSGAAGGGVSEAGSWLGRVVDARDDLPETQALSYALAVGLVLGLGGVFGGGADGTEPALLDFRPAGRLSALREALASALGRGLLLAAVFGTVLGVCLPPGLWSPAAGSGRSEQFAAGPAIALLFALVCSPWAAVVRWARTPADIDQVSPESALRGDRRMTLSLLGFAVLPFTAKALVDAGFGGGAPVEQAVRDSFTTAPTTVILGLAVGLTLAAQTAHSAFLVTRARLAADGVLPLRLMAFLREAHRLGVLRQVGAAYQFRHARLQDRLAAAHGSAQDGAARDAGNAGAGSLRPSNE